MAIDELTNVVPVPAGRTSVKAPEGWGEIENKLGIKFPDDYKAFFKVYGTGVFKNEQFHIFVLNPLDELDSVIFDNDTLQLIKDMEDLEENGGFPCEVFPTTPGLFAWGRDNNGNILCWLTDGAPADWPIVLRSRENEYETLAMSMTTFLAETFSGRLKCILWPASYFSGAKGVRFELRSPLRVGT